MATETAPYPRNPGDDRLPLVTWVGLAALATALAAAAQRVERTAFARFLGAVPPAALVGGLGLAALGLLATPLARRWLPVHGPQTAPGVRRAGLAAVGFGAVVVAGDWLIVFPADMNVALPGALLFYPAIGFVVEVLFHVLPFLLVTLLLARLGGEPVPVRWMTGAVFLLALIEPGYQVLALVTSDAWSAGAAVFVAVHVYLINVVQLGLYRRFDLVSMLAFRVFYYAIWHVAWGYLRLHLLF